MHSGARTALALGAVLASGLACMPPPMNIGYVSLDPSRAGVVDVQGQAGGGGFLPRGTGGGASTMHVDPFVAPRVSLPIGVGLGGSTLGGHALLRVGVRHRALKVLAWGGGIGPSIIFDRRTAAVTGVGDLELILGRQWTRVGFSLGLRPAMSFDSTSWGFFFFGEPTLAVIVAPKTSLTLALIAGVYDDPYIDGGAGFMAGGLGVHRRF